MAKKKKPPETEKTPVREAVTNINNEESASSQSGNTGWLKTTESIISSLKVIAWPLVIIILVASFWNPIYNTIAQLPNLISSASKISVGPFTLEMERVAKAIGNESLGQLMGGLSPRAIELLIETGGARYILVGTDKGPNNNMITLPNEIDIEALKELNNKELLEFNEPLEEFLVFFQSLGLIQDTSISASARYYKTSRPLTKEEINRLEDQMYFLTDLGKEAFDLVVRTISSYLETPTSSTQ